MDMTDVPSLIGVLVNSVKNGSQTENVTLSVLNRNAEWILRGTTNILSQNYFSNSIYPLGVSIHFSTQILITKKEHMEQYKFKTPTQIQSLSIRLSKEAIEWLRGTRGDHNDHAVGN